MRKYIKHLILLTLILVGLFNIQNISYGDGVKPYDLHLTIDGKKVNFTDELGHPMLIKETQRTIVPVRIISENMGYKVGWDQKTKTATISDNKTKIEVKIGENTALVNGKRVHMDKDNDGTIHNTQAMLIPAKGSSRTYVPLRFIAEAMGAKVDYKRINGKNYIEIWTGKNVVEEPTVPSKIKGNADKMTTEERYAAVREFFGEYQYQNTIPTFRAIPGVEFFWIAEDPGEVMIVIHSWDTPEGQVVAEKLGSAHLYKLINPAVKEVLRFYLPNGGADELYKIIDDGFNSRLASRDAVINKDISGLIGADRPVKIVPGGGLRIYIGTK